MEFHFQVLSIIFTFLLCLFMAIKIAQPKDKKLCPKMPPGPPKLPFVGNLHQLVGSLPHRRLRDLARKHGPLMQLQLGEVTVAVISSPEIAKEVLKTNDLILAQRPLALSHKKISYDYSGMAFSPYGNYWRQIRKFSATKLLSTKRVQSFRSLREEEVSNLIKELHSHKGLTVNLSEKIFTLIFSITSTAAFGIKCKYIEEFISAVVEYMKINTGFYIADLYPSIKLLPVISGMEAKFDKLYQKSDRIMQNILNEHKKRMVTTKREVEDNLLDVLLDLQQIDDREFCPSDNNIKAVIWEIFSAGTETSAAVIEWAMAELVKNPRVMKSAQTEVRKVFDGKRNVDESCIHELKFLSSVVKETLRLHPPGPLLSPRESMETCEINGYAIPAKTRVITNAWAIARDPRYWTDAETFYPERFLNSSIDYKGMDFEYIPFGTGRRICPGLVFAIANIELPLAQLLYHFDWKLPDEMKHEDLDMTERPGLPLRRKKDLFLIPIPYHCLSNPDYTLEE